MLRLCCRIFAASAVSCPDLHIPYIPSVPSSDNHLSAAAFPCPNCYCISTALTNTDCCSSAAFPCAHCCVFIAPTRSYRCSFSVATCSSATK